MASIDVPTRRVGAWAALLALAMAPRPVTAQFADSVTIRHVAGAVYMLAGAGDVVGVSAGPDGILLVDNGFPETVERVRAALAKLPARDPRPRYVINTHWHHAGANAAFAESAAIVAHRAARARLADTSLMYGQPVPPKPPDALPTITFDDSLSLEFNGEEIRLVHLPGAHTDGDIAVFFTRSNVVQLGDVFVTLIPVTDYHTGGELDSLLSAIDYLLRRVPRNAAIIPGHGRLATYDDLVTYRAMLSDMVAHVRAQMVAGRTAEQVVEGGVPAKWEPWLQLIPAAFVLRNFYDGLARSTRR